jgi:hypothetical protein
MGKECFDTLSMNGISNAKSILSPFVVSVSKDFEEVFTISAKRQRARIKPRKIEKGFQSYRYGVSPEYPIQ